MTNFSLFPHFAKNPVKVVRFVKFAIIALLLCGCFSSHYERTENFQFLWKIGDLQKAEIEADRLSREGPKRDRLLYYLERGAVARMQGDQKKSIAALDYASREYDHWFGPHLRTETKISEELRKSLLLSSTGKSHFVEIFASFIEKDSKNVVVVLLLF